MIRHVLNVAGGVGGAAWVASARLAVPAGPRPAGVPHSGISVRHRDLNDNLDGDAHRAASPQPRWDAFLTPAPHRGVRCRWRSPGDASRRCLTSRFGASRVYRPGSLAASPLR